MHVTWIFFSRDGHGFIGLTPQWIVHPKVSAVGTKRALSFASSLRRGRSTTAIILKTLQYVRCVALALNPLWLSSPFSDYDAQKKNPQARGSELWSPEVLGAVALMQWPWSFPDDTRPLWWRRVSGGFPHGALRGLRAFFRKFRGFFPFFLYFTHIQLT